MRQILYLNNVHVPAAILYFVENTTIDILKKKWNEIIVDIMTSLKISRF